MWYLSLIHIYAQPKTYTLTVNFEYEDAEGNEYTAQELLGINVEQVTELNMDEFAMPETEMCIRDRSYRNHCGLYVLYSRQRICR